MARQVTFGLRTRPRGSTRPQETGQALSARVSSSAGLLSTSPVPHGVSWPRPDVTHPDGRDAAVTGVTQP